MAKVNIVLHAMRISARRNVSNKDTEKTLSSLSSRIYKKLESNNKNPDVIEQFKETLGTTDEQLNGIYSTIFHEVIEDVKRFGGVSESDTVIKIVSSLQHRELLEENTTVMYGINANGHSLPEHYNGLGYMNLISMIFEIRIKLHEFEKEMDEKPADINLLFIEEPEVHTHPQMQRIFVSNIKALLKHGIVRVDGIKRGLQSIISTHSSHIVSESNFDDIKYFKRENRGIVSKNLKDLEAQYAAEVEHYKFLKQYLTIHRSELFFADKAVFIEGDTERILLPAMMKKIDQEDFITAAEAGEAQSLPLLSQNISIIEVGAYAQVYEKCIDFIGIKSLVLTDIDSIKPISKTKPDGSTETKDGACPVAEGVRSSNSSLSFFYGAGKTLAELIALTSEQRRLKKDKTTNNWFSDPEGFLLCVYQLSEQDSEGANYHARSFEDAFFHVNKAFLRAKCLDDSGALLNNHLFQSLRPTYIQNFFASEEAYVFAEGGVVRKPPFAMEILINSESTQRTYTPQGSTSPINIEIEFANWNTPAYIKEGLQWLKS